LTTFAALFVPPGLREAVSDRAWLQAMLDAERALANAASLTGAIPADAAAAISTACEASFYDVDELATRGRAAGNPAEPLVRALRERVGGDEAEYVHRGATSQDVLDTAAMLVARNALGLIREELDGDAPECARLARVHRSTPFAARTLLQQAVPTTFGYKAARWLAALLDARARLRPCGCRRSSAAPPERLPCSASEDRTC
jgi:3-carboxy-cis,cis-muconate cycloisomerase